MTLYKSFNYSYWELKQFFSAYDLIVVGSGIVGLSTAISFKQKNKKASILVLDKGIFLDGASTKNAGFACFGSAGELVSDLETMKEEVVWDTVEMRWNGLGMLRKRLKDKNMNYQQLGGYELFDDDKKLAETMNKLAFLNIELKKRLGLNVCYSEDKKKKEDFYTIKGVLKNKYEGQIDTGLMMKNLLLLAQKAGITTLNGITVSAINDLDHKVELVSDRGVFSAHKVLVATNGFASQLLNLRDVKPARAQVLITKPINALKIKGAFHYQEGYYYFRNIENRILFGGGRNLDFKGETTHKPGVNLKIQSKLDEILKNVILHDTAYEVEHRWSGIMGVGSEKKPIIKKTSKNVLAAVRMGGMGIAIGSWVGEKAAGHLE